MTSHHDNRTPASIAMDEAIEASLDGRHLFPDGAMFINGDEPHIGRAIAQASDENRVVVLCYTDGTRRVLHPAPPLAAG
jgi:hypothetical protein